MNKKLWVLLNIFLALTWTACSSSHKSSDEEAPDPNADVAAQTDAVPADGAELPNPDAPPSDGDALAQLDSPPPAAKKEETPPPVAESAPPPATNTPPETSAPPATSVATSSGDTTDYTVQRSDTLMKIAFENYGDLYMWKKIYEMNKDVISNPNDVKPGTKIKIEKSASGADVAHNGDKYVIKKGDTLGTISEEVYGTKRKWKRLWENNKQLIKDPNKIYAGFFLYYMMTDQDRQELEQFKQQAPTTNPQPLAGGKPTDPARAPASTGPVTPAPAGK